MNKISSAYAETHETWDKLAQKYASHFMSLDLYDGIIILPE